MGRSREIGSVSEPYAFSRSPMFSLRSAALHCARTSALGPETAYEKVQGAGPRAAETRLAQPALAAGASREGSSRALTPRPTRIEAPNGSPAMPPQMPTQRPWATAPPLSRRSGGARRMQKSASLASFECCRSMANAY